MEYGIPTGATVNIDHASGLNLAMETANHGMENTEQNRFSTVLTVNMNKKGKCSGKSEEARSEETQSVSCWKRYNSTPIWKWLTLHIKSQKSLKHFNTDINAWNFTCNFRS